MLYYDISKKDTSKAERLQRLMFLMELEIPEFADFICYSEPHVYALLNGTRELTDGTISFLEEKLGITDLFDLDNDVTDRIKAVVAEKKARNEQWEPGDYIRKTGKKLSYALEHQILPLGLTKGWFSAEQFLEILTGLNRKVAIKSLRSSLNYLVAKKVLVSKKVRIPLTDGGLGARLVRVYALKGEEDSAPSE